MVLAQSPSNMSEYGRCAVHTGAAALAVCSRCGNFACAACVDSKMQDVCRECAARASDSTTGRSRSGANRAAQYIVVGGGTSAFGGTSVPTLAMPPSFSPFPWMKYAFQEYGQREVSGSTDNPRVQQYLSARGLATAHDETH